MPTNGVILGSFWYHYGVIWGHLGSFWVEKRAEKYFNTGQSHQALVQAAWPWWPRGTFGHMLGSLLVAMDGRCTRTSVTEHQPTAGSIFSHGANSRPGGQLHHTQFGAQPVGQLATVDPGGALPIPSGGNGSRTRQAGGKRGYISQIHDFLGAATEKINLVR